MAFSSTKYPFRQQDTPRDKRGRPKKPWNPEMSGAELPLRVGTQIWGKPEWPPGARAVPKPEEVRFKMKELKRPRPVSVRTIMPSLNNLPETVTPEMVDILANVARRNHAQRLKDIDRRGRIAAARNATLQSLEQSLSTDTKGGGRGGTAPGRRASNASSELTTPFEREWMQWRRKDEATQPIPCLAAAARVRMHEDKMASYREERKAWWAARYEEERAASEALKRETAKANAFLKY
mmetsp:Transcript_10440/g.28601  ORF Transcript_10440/g.28601 Transcript_10440/m.28601 type:complete len:237 (-) Transcript_10440:726-1436(-)